MRRLGRHGGQLVMMGVLLAASSCVRPHTGLVIDIATDLVPPDGIDRVRLVVERSGGRDDIAEEWPISGIVGQPYSLPGSFGVYPQDPDETPTVRIRVTGFAGSRPIVERRAVVTMRAYQTLFLRMALVGLCKDKPCPDDGTTCVEGVCVPEAIDATLLPAFREPMLAPEQPAQCRSRVTLIDTSTRQPLLPLARSACRDNERCVESVCYRVAPHCLDSITNADEPDTDCGGRDCRGCASTQPCFNDSDCLTGACYAPAGSPSGECSPALAFRRSSIGPPELGPVALAARDLDGDRRSDLIAAYGDRSVIDVYRRYNDVDLAFDSQQSYPTVDSPIALATGDFNRDSWPDVIVAYRAFSGGSNGIQVFLGQNDASLVSAGVYPLAHRPGALASGDLNADGMPDLVIANPDAGSISVLLNDGDGAFPTGVDYASGPIPIAVTIANFDGGDHPDIVVANSDYFGFDGNVSIFHGLENGAGFSAPDLYRAGIDPHAVVAGDFDDDGRVDVAVVDNGGQSVYLLINQSAATPGAPERVPFETFAFNIIGTDPIAIATGDLEGNGTAGLAVTSRRDGIIAVLADFDGRVFLQNVNNTIGSGARAVVLTDFNNDALGDAAVATNHGLVLLPNISQ